jgi:hypothetical protein
MITGSGPQDRDNSNVEMVPNYRPYRQIAARLASEGIATLRYDDRGVGESTGDVNVATPPELATDVEAALAYLVQRPEIDSQQIGLLGHSEGGLLAGIVAADNPRVAFVVLLAGQTVDMPTLQAAAVRRQAEAMGQAEMGERLAEQELEAAALAAAEDWEALEEHLYEQYTAQLQNAGAGNDVDQETVAQMVQQIVNQSMSEYQSRRYLFGARYNPGEDWSQVTVPVLALYAEHDYNVPADLNHPALTQALAGAGNEDVTVETIAGVNHLFIKADDADPASWGSGATNLKPEVLARMATWLRGHTELAASSSQKER